ncbi:MAG TPA: hypothetical protein VK168_04520 [Saprospiraceae bacterium]|nr:hypothetical protein [Saprospiraceae bacterium]
MRTLLLMSHLLGGCLALLLILSPACRKKEKDCAPCPNNTICNDGDCGCKPDQHDMGNWCLDKNENLFVAASLDCPCLQTQGLRLVDIQPYTGDGLPFPGKSTYAFYQPDNPYSGYPEKFHYFDLPDGDSIAIHNLVGPGIVGFYNCKVNDSLICEIDILGKFHGPDTIETTVHYTRCRLDLDNYVSDEEIRHLTFVRKQ